MKKTLFSDTDLKFTKPRIEIEVTNPLSAKISLLSSPISTKNFNCLPNINSSLENRSTKQKLLKTSNARTILKESTSLKCIERVSLSNTVKNKISDISSYANNELKTRMSRMQKSLCTIKFRDNNDKIRTSNISKEEISNLQRKIELIKIPDQKVNELYETEENKLFLKAFNLNYFMISSKNQFTPLKIQFKGILGDSSINMYSSNIVKRPNKDNSNEKFFILTNDKIYRICNNEEKRKKFTADYIYLSFESNIEQKLIVVFSFGIRPLFFQTKNETLFTRKSKVINIVNPSLIIGRIDDHIKLLINDKDKLNLCYQMANESIQRRRIKNLGKGTFINIIEKNANVKASYSQFLSRRSQSINFESEKQKLVSNKKTLHIKKELKRKAIKSYREEIKTIKKKIVLEYIRRKEIDKINAVKWFFLILLYKYFIQLFTYFKLKKDLIIYELKKKVSANVIKFIVKKIYDQRSSFIKERTLLNVKNIFVLSFSLRKDYCIMNHLSVIKTWINISGKSIILKGLCFSLIMKICTIQNIWRNRKIGEYNKYNFLSQLWDKRQSELYIKLINSKLHNTKKLGLKIVNLKKEIKEKSISLYLEKISQEYRDSILKWSSQISTNIQSSISRTKMRNDLGKNNFSLNSNKKFTEANFVQERPKYRFIPSKIEFYRIIANAADINLVGIKF